MHCRTCRVGLVCCSTCPPLPPTLQIEAEQGLAAAGMNPIFYPKYWLGLYLDDYPAYAWTDGLTPGPDVFSKAAAGAYYSHWGSYMWVVGAAISSSAPWPPMPAASTSPPARPQVGAGRAQQP